MSSPDRAPHLSLARAQAAPAVDDRYIVCVALTPACAERLGDACAPHALADLVARDLSPLVERADLLCVDPALLVDNLRLKAQVLALTSSGIPCVFYTESSSDSLRAVVSMQSSITPLCLLIRGVDDTRASLAALLALSARDRDGALLAHVLRELLAGLPIGVREAMALVIRQPQRFFDAADVARRAGLSRRHVDRILTSSGLAPAKDWVIAARAFHATRRLALSSQRVSDAARILGYSDEKGLRRHMKTVWNLTPRHVMALDQRSLVSGVLRFLSAERAPGPSALL